MCDFNLRSYFSNLYSMKLLGEDPHEINDLRCVLQIASVCLALSKGIDPEDLNALKSIAEQMDTALEKKDMESFHQLDARFHRAICGLCHNEPLYIIYDALEYIINDITRMNVEQSFRQNEGYRVISDFHNHLLKYICEADIDRFIEEIMESRERSMEYYDANRKIGE